MEATEIIRDIRLAHFSLEPASYYYLEPYSQRRRNPYWSSPPTLQASHRDSPPHIHLRCRYHESRRLGPAVARYYPADAAYARGSIRRGAEGGVHLCTRGLLYDVALHLRDGMEECEERGAGAKNTRQKGSKGKSQGDSLKHEELGDCIAPCISELFSSVTTTVDKGI